MALSLNRACVGCHFIALLEVSFPAPGGALASPALQVPRASHLRLTIRCTSDKWKGHGQERRMCKNKEANWELERLGNQALAIPVSFLSAEAVLLEGVETDKLSATCIPSGTEQGAMVIGSTLQTGVQ